MDNFKLLKENLDEWIDPAALPGQILASNHNQFDTLFMEMQGKYTGSPFRVKGGFPDVIANGVVHFSGAMNNTVTDITMRAATFTADQNDFGIMLWTKQKGDVLHLKDYEGRSFYFTITGSDKVADGSGGFRYDVTLRAFAGNQNYTYQVDDDMVSIIEMVAGMDYKNLLRNVDLSLSWAKFDGTGDFPLDESAFDPYFKSVYFAFTIHGTPDVYAKVRNLIVKTRRFDLIENYEPTVLIERYTHHKYKGRNEDTNTVYYQIAGYKRDRVQFDDRPNQFSLLSENFIQDIGAELYFNQVQFPQPKGLGRRNLTYIPGSGSPGLVKGNVYLRFMLQITVNGVKYISEPKVNLKMVGTCNQGTGYNLISYGLQ